MTGIILALLAGFSQSCIDLVNKKALGRVRETTVAWCMVALSLPFLLPIVLLYEPLPRIAPQFWLVLAADTGLEVAGLLLYLRAVKLSEISRVVPMMAFTPLLLLMTSPLILGEFPRPAGLAGVVLVVAGAYVLNISAVRQGWTAPFQALLSDQGARCMLVAAFIWSITSNLVKLGLQYSSPLMWSFAMHSAFALALFPFAARRGGISLGAEISVNWKLLGALGFLAALSVIVHTVATSLILVIYVIAIKRCCIIFSTILGHAVLKEGDFPQRITAAVIMAAGIALIVTGGGL